MFFGPLLLEAFAMANENDLWALLIITVLSVGPVLVTLYFEARQAKANRLANRGVSASALDQ